MQFEVYCDESNPEVLIDRGANDFLVLGSLWMPADFRQQFKEDIANLKKKFGYCNEIKWNKVAPSTFEFYNALLVYFFTNKNLRFRALLAEADKIDLVKFHNGDGELSFYKFYYQLLNHWIFDYNEYSIFVDHKVNKDTNRVSKLQEVLSASNLTSKICNVQALPSKQSLGIQLADFLMGIVNGKFNAKISSLAKLDLLKNTESLLKHEIKPTYKYEEKFNIFKINLQGGW
jgi:hypothetical protein